MESFARALKCKFEDQGLDTIENALRQLIAKKEKVTDIRTLSPVAKMPFKIHDLLQIGLRRGLELSEASVRELNRQNVSTSLVLIRAVFETSCLLFDSVNRVVDTTTNGDLKLLGELDKFLMDVLVGFKSKRWGDCEEFQARNVLTLIERLTKRLGLDLMYYYEGLSEHAHPNYLGMMAVYRMSPEEGSSIVRYADSPNRSRDSSLIIGIGGLAIALDMIKLALDHHADVAANFARMCERAIYDAGGWPVGAPLRK